MNGPVIILMVFVKISQFCEHRSSPFFQLTSSIISILILNGQAEGWLCILTMLTMPMKSETCIAAYEIKWLN